MVVDLDSQLQILSAVTVAARRLPEYRLRLWRNVIRGEMLGKTGSTAFGAPTRLRLHESSHPSTVSQASSAEPQVD
jgi:hypothetical protein